MTQMTISVPEIHCNHCKMSIEGAVTSLRGVRTAIVDVDTRTVDVAFDEPASFDAIKDAIEDQGYDVPAQN
jgi:copper chaperone